MPRGAIWIPDPAGLQAFERPVDCPIQDYVWRHLAESGPTARVAVIVEVRANDSPALLASLLASALGGTNVVAYGRYVLAATTFDELITHLLPLSQWAGFVTRACRLLRALRATKTPSPSQFASLDWSVEDSALLRWLAAHVATAHDVQLLERRDGLMPVPAILADLLEAAIETVKASNSRPVRTVGLDRAVDLAVTESRKTIKVDAAERVFGIDASNVIWAVVDTGIDRDHEAFGGPGNKRIVRSYDIPRAVDAMRLPERNFVPLFTDDNWAEFMGLADVTNQPSDLRFSGARNDHGTHVAGVLAANARNVVAQPGKPQLEGEVLPSEIIGICPSVRLIDLKVFDGNGTAREFHVMVALAFVNWMNDRQRVAVEDLGPGRRIDGVNLSLAVKFDVDSHACGWTPVCRQCDDLVNAGVVVVAAAGNAGFQENLQLSQGEGFRMISITDPGNTESVITVGATETREPHRRGPTARSGRGPTADGRHKPDLLAPGSRILGPAAGGGWARYSGTSQAAAHVSGAAAMLLSRFPELVGQPRRVKELMTSTATDLGRIEDFQGKGLLDVLRVLQAM